MGYVVAKYIRLSVEDALSDSYSIENQHWQLDKCIAGMPQSDIEVLEFVDNGHTGTNLERSGLQELLSLARQGRLDCIVVKDFSRLGRNMIDVGYFIEKVFPAYRIRLVSLGDKYDSAQTRNGAGTMDTTFNLLVNELYSKDLSKKIRRAKEDRTQKGLSVTKNCVLGYKLDAHRKMVVDEKAAGTVRLIFSMALQGETPAKIARRLYMEKHPTPGAYKGHKTRKSQTQEFECVWSKGY